MKFFEMLAEFFGSPVEKVTEWLDALAEALGVWWSDLLHTASIGITSFVIEGVAVCVIAYTVYCACRIMMTTKDETFSEYINKSMLAGLFYFFARYGGNLLLYFLGA